MYSPYYYNLLIALCMMVYVKVAVAVCDALVRRGVLSHVASRKVVHLGATCLCLFFPLFDTSHWTWRLNVLTCGLYAVQLVVKGLILNNPHDPDVQSMSRTGRPIELLYGPLVFALAMVYIGLFEFKTSTGTYMLASMGIGDGVAPLAGMLWPTISWGRYPTMGGGYKTLSGSMAMFVGTIVGTAFLRRILGEPAVWQTDQVLGVALVATVAEACSGMLDNLAIATSVPLFLWATSSVKVES